MRRCSGEGASWENYGANPKVSDLPRALQEWTHIPRSGQIVTRQSARVPECQAATLVCPGRRTFGCLSVYF